MSRESHPVIFIVSSRTVRWLQHEFLLPLALCTSERVKLVRSETVGVESSTQPAPASPLPEDVLTRAQRAHWRLSWKQHLARNARRTSAPRLSVTLHGLPATFARTFGFDLLATA